MEPTRGGERKKERERKKKIKTQYGHIKQGSEVVGPAYVLPTKKCDVKLVE